MTRPGWVSEDEIRDLGFGAVVSQESRQRLLNRDGSFNVARSGLRLGTSLSLYHTLLTTTWTRFMALVVVSYVLVNAVFGLAFVLCGPGALQPTFPGAGEAGFARAFFFSVETFSTIGYGTIAPVGLAANLVVTVEALAGLLWLALATGLLFARFSRPTAKIMFSRTAVIAPYRGIRAFEFRIANMRSSQLIEVQATVMFTRFEEHGGRQVRRYYQLPLERSAVTFFPLSWTIVHPIDEASPLNGLTRDDMRRSDAEFLVLLSGVEETFAQRVHARSSYRWDEVVWGAKFSDILHHPSGTEAVTLDVSRLDSIEPAA
ncbi:MAG TPA: ion channel [Gemmatimonadales bacterium]|nr:ion channel [Gemmatimonadales bacterium]